MIFYSLRLNALKSHCKPLFMIDFMIDNKDVFDKVTEKSKESSRKRKSPSPLPMAPPNKVLVISEPSNHILRTSENKQSQVLQITKHQNFSLIKVNETSGWFLSLLSTFM